MAQEKDEKRQLDFPAMITGMRNGDEGAYRRFYDLYFDRLYRYIQVLTGGKEDETREAVQETMIRVARYVRGFATEEAFWSWLTVLARSVVIDLQRKRKRHFHLLQRFYLQFHSSKPDLFESRLAGALDESLRKLSPADLSLLERKYAEGESVREIARALGTTEKTVESRLVRIRKQLKQIILTELKNEERI